MEIAYIYDAVYPSVKGGVEKRIYEIGRRLSKNHEVHWFGLDWGSYPESIIFHPVGKWRHLYINHRRSILEALYFSLRLLTKFGKEKYDIIDCQQFPYISCFSIKFHTILRDIPTIITWHEVWGNYWKEYLGKIGFIGREFERVMFRIGNANVSVSRLTYGKLLEHNIRSTIIPNGVDYKKIQKISPVNDGPDIVFVGRLIPEKNVKLLLEAVETLNRDIPDIQVVIIGDGPERNILEAYVKEHNLTQNVVFMGTINDHDKVISYMKASKLLVLPSKREGFGMVALEANASGIPVVTVDYPLNAAKDLVINGYNGAISTPSRESLAKAILEIMEKK